MLKDTFPYQVRNIPDDEEERHVPDEDNDVIEEGLYALSLPVVLCRVFGSGWDPTFEKNRPHFKSLIRNPGSMVCIVLNKNSLQSVERSR